MTTQTTNVDRRTSVIDMYEEAPGYFMGEGTLNKTLERLSRDLDERGIDYMVIGAVALLAHGYPRFTEDIDLVMTAEGLEKFHEELVGLGYAPAFPGKKLRSTVDGVSIEVMTTGEKLDADFAAKLDPYVRPKYLELEAAVRQSESNQE